VPSIKCPMCGQRILDAAGLVTCPNCGGPLVPQLVAARGSSYDDPRAHLVVDSMPGINNNDTSPIPTVEPISNNQFPSGFPKRPPDLVGTVILIDSHEEPKRNNAIGDMVFNTIVDLLWAIPGSSGSQQNKEKEKAQVTRVRIRTPDDIQRDVRMEGHLRGVNIAQGDLISLWGKQNNGLLAFEYGYNHTTFGTIKTSKTASPKISGILLLIVGIIGILLLYYYYSNNPILP